MNNIGGIGVTLKADFDDSGIVRAMANVKGASQGVSSQLKNTDAQIQKSQGVFSKYAAMLSQKMGQVTKSFRVQKGAASQMGMQLQDVAVMAQYGADKMVILGQQGSQIASMFGPGGAMLGALIAIGSAVAGVAFKMSETAKETENLSQKLRDLAETSALTADEQAYLNELDKKSTEEKKKRVSQIEDEITAQEKAIQKLATFNALTEQQQSLQRSSMGVGQTSVNKMAGDAETAQKALIKLRAELAYLNRQINGTEETKGETQQSDYNLTRVNKLRDSIDAEKGLLQTRRQLYYAVANEIISDERSAAMMQEAEQQSRIDAQLQKTSEALAKEREMVRNDTLLSAEERAANLAVINKAEREAGQLHLEQKMQATRKHEQAITEIEATEAQKRAKVAEAERRQKVAIASGMMGNLSSLMNTESRKLFEIGKTASIAGALIDGYEAVQGAYKIGAKMGGPALGAAYAATAAVATAAQVQQIASTKFGSAGTGQSFSGGQVVNNEPQQTQPDRNISIALTGSSFSGGDIRSLIGAINDELGDGVTLNTTGG